MIAIAAVMACNKVETNELPPVSTSEEKGYDVIYATAEATKTGLVGSGINEHIEWVKGDKVKIFNSSGTGKEYTAQSNGSAVAFAADDSLTGMECALYPASCATKRSNTRQILAKLPAIQDGSFHNVIFGGVPATDPQQFIFTAVTSVIKINIPAEKNIIGLVVESDNAICGDFTADYQSGTKVWNTITTASTGKTITIQAEAGKILSGDIYVAVLPKTSAQNLTIKLYSSAKFGSKTKSVEHLNVNTIEDFGTASISLNKYMKGFTIDAEGNQVFFSPGMLQYQPKTKNWRFAKNEWDWVGAKAGNKQLGNVFDGDNVHCDNAVVYDSESLSSYGGWIDLFGFGSSGFEGTSPTEIRGTAASQGGIYATCNLNGTNYDWGRFCEIYYNDQIDHKGQWRTLSLDEWKFLASDKSKAGSATVNDVQGMILLSDGFVDPCCNEKTNSEGIFKTLNKSQEYEANIYHGINWVAMSNAGACFIPNCGWISNATNYSTESYFLWSSTYGNDSKAYRIGFSKAQIGTNDQPQPSNLRYAVRLVRDVPAE